MKILRGLPMPPSTRPGYNFDALQHGDVIVVRSVLSAQEMFRRWKRKTGRHGKLVRGDEYTDGTTALHFEDHDLPQIIDVAEEDPV